MAAKQSSTNRAGQAQVTASVSRRLAPILDRLVTLIEVNHERDYDVRLALAERAAQLANALLDAMHDPHRDTVKAAIGIARTA